MTKFRLGYFVEVLQEGVDAHDADNRAILNMGFDGLQFDPPDIKTLPAIPGAKGSPLLTTEVCRCRCVIAVASPMQTRLLAAQLNYPDD